MTFPLLSSPRKTGGFSLSELLIAMVILAVLFVLALPVIQNVRSRSEAATCLSNLRQISMAGLQQIADRNGRLPDMGVYCSHKNADIALSLLPYLGYPVPGGDYRHHTVFTCPAAWKAIPTDTAMRRTYGINRYATGSRVNQPDDFEKIRDAVVPRFSAIASPSSMAFFMDGSSRGPGNPSASYYVYQTYSGLTPGETAGTSTYVHGGAIQVAYMDGHVGRITREVAEADLIERASTRLPFWGALK